VQKHRVRLRNHTFHARWARSSSELGGSESNGPKFRCRPVSLTPDRFREVRPRQNINRTRRGPATRMHRAAWRLAAAVAPQLRSGFRVAGAAAAAAAVAIAVGSPQQAAPAPRSAAVPALPTPAPKPAVEAEEVYEEGVPVGEDVPGHSVDSALPRMPAPIAYHPAVPPPIGRRKPAHLILELDSVTERLPLTVCGFALTDCPAAETAVRLEVGRRRLPAMSPSINPPRDCSRLTSSTSGRSMGTAPGLLCAPAWAMCWR